MKMRRHLAVFGLLCVLALSTYANAVDNQFMIDDFGYSDPGLRLSHDRPTADLFLRPHNHHYNPLDPLINTALFSRLDDPRAFRIINITLLVVLTFLVYRLIDQISGSFHLGVLTAFLFCLHPLTAENVYHNTFVPVFLWMILMVTSFLCFVRYVQGSNKPALYIFSILLYIGALLILEFSLILPVAMLFWLLIVHRATFKKAIVILLPFILLSAVFLFLWSSLTVVKVRPLERVSRHNFSLIEFLAAYAHAVFWYLKNAFWPEHIVFMRNFNFGEGISKIPLVGLGVIVAGMIWRGRRGPLVLWATSLVLAGFCVAAIPSLVHLEMGLVFEPYWMFFSSLGVFLLLALGIMRLQAYLGKASFIAVLLAVAVYGYTYTWSYNVIARTEYGYAEHWLKHSPGNRIPMMILATLYSYGEGYKIPPELCKDMVKMAQIYMDKGIHDRAADLLNVLARDCPVR